MLNRLNYLLGAGFLLVALYFFANPVASLSILGVLTTVGFLAYSLSLGRKALKTKDGMERSFTYAMMVWTIFSLLRTAIVVRTEALLLANILGYLTFLYLMKIAEGLLSWYQKKEGYQTSLIQGVIGLVVVFLVNSVPLVGQFVFFNMIGLSLLAVSIYFFYKGYHASRN